MWLIYKDFYLWIFVDSVAHCYIMVAHQHTPRDTHMETFQSEQEIEAAYDEVCAAIAAFKAKLQATARNHPQTILAMVAEDFLELSPCN